MFHGNPTEGQLELWKPMCTILKQKPRSVISTVTPLSSASLLRVSGMHTTLWWRIYKKDLQDLIRGHQISGKAQCGTTGYSYLNTPLQSIWCQKMTGVLYAARWVTLVATAPSVQCYNYDRLWPLHPLLSREDSTYQESPMPPWQIALLANHVMTTTIGTDPSPLITDTAKEDALQSVRITPLIPLWQKAPATIRGTHSTFPIPPLTAAHNTHQPKDTLGNHLTGTPWHWHDQNSSMTYHFSCTRVHSRDYCMDQSWSNLRHSDHTPHRPYT